MTPPVERRSSICGMLKDGFCGIMAQPDGAIPRLHEKINGLEGDLYCAINKKVSWAVFWTILVLFVSLSGTAIVSSFSYSKDLFAATSSERQRMSDKRDYEIKALREEWLTELRLLRADIKEIQNGRHNRTQ